MKSVCSKIFANAVVIEKLSEIIKKNNNAFRVRQSGRHEDACEITLTKFASS